MKKPWFNVGSRITIKERPAQWASVLCQNNPMYGLSFPCNGTVKEIYDGKYYWGLKIEVDRQDWGFAYNRSTKHVFKSKERNIEKLLKRIDETR